MANKSRCFCFELYPDSESYDFNEILDYIMINFDYAYISHDSDIYDKDEYDENTFELIHKVGEKKKTHIHVLINFENPRSINTIKELIGHDIYINSCNFYGYTRYLIHLGYPNKHQYPREAIITNMELRVNNALKCDYNSSEQDSRILLDYLYSRNFTTFKDLTLYAIKNNCLGELQKRAYFYNLQCDNYKL